MGSSSPRRQACRQFRQLPRRDVSSIDYVDSGLKWASGDFTYSFPTSASFYAGFERRRLRLRRAEQRLQGLQRHAAGGDHVDPQHVFAGGQRHLHADHRDDDAERDLALRGIQSCPARPGATIRRSSPEGGDAWFNSSSGWYNNPVLGNYAYLTIIHETGHLLGLKHPHDVVRLVRRGCRSAPTRSNTR